MNIKGFWRYVGCNNTNWLWTNGDDVAWERNADPGEIEEFPHPNAEINYGCISQDYNGDVILEACCLDMLSRPASSTMLP